MLIKFDKFIDSLDDIKEFKFTDPIDAFCLLIFAICNYEKNKDIFYEMLKKATNTDNISENLKQKIDEQLTKNNKQSYIGNSYFYGTTRENNYTPFKPYTLEIVEGPYAYQNEGYATLHIKSSGADLPRPVTFEKTKDNKWYATPDSIFSLIKDIKRPKSK